jgi:putative tricarboxylic transport membrane protein
MLLLLNLPLAPLWAKLLKIPRPYLYAGILLFATLGTYAVNGSTVDLWVLLAIGALGFTMRRFGLPIVPLIVGVILLPNAEQQMRRALQLSGGQLSGLVNSPFGIVVYTIIVALLVVPLLRRRRR